MRELSAAELLEVWERSSARSPTERALTVLSAANRSIESEALAAMSIGRRDELLLSVRESVFGPQLMAIVDCPECRQQLEFSVNVDELRISNSEIGPPAPIVLAVDGYEISFRLPDSRDLIAAGAAGDIESARKTLLERCLLAARNDSSEVSTDRLPKEIIETVEQENGQATVIRFPIDDVRYYAGDVLLVLAGTDIHFHGMIGQTDNGFAIASDRRGSLLPATVQ